LNQGWFIINHYPFSIFNYRVAVVLL